MNESSLVNIITLVILGIIHKIFQGEVKVEEQSVAAKENTDDDDRLLFDVDRGKTFLFAFYISLLYNVFFFFILFY